MQFARGSSTDDANCRRDEKNLGQEERALSLNVTRCVELEERPGRFHVQVAQETGKGKEKRRRVSLFRGSAAGFSRGDPVERVSRKPAATWLCNNQPAHVTAMR